MVPRNAHTRARSFDPGAGLRALLALVNDALGESGLRATPALAGGAFAAHMSVDLGGTTHTGRPVKPSPRLRPASGAHPPESEAVPELDEEHTETWRLVVLAQGGDGAAFGQLYDRYVDVVYRFIFFRIHDRGLAEDFTSETFLRALRRIGTISYQGRDIGAWFVTIARNIVLDHVKSARHRLEITTADALEDSERAPSTEDAVLESLSSEALLVAVAELGDEQRECVLLRFMQGLSVSETAAVMGKNDGAIKALQHRAVLKLAELIGGDPRE